MVGLSVKTESIFYPSLTGCLRFLWKSQNMGPWDEIYWHWPLYPKILGVNKTVLLMNTLPQIPESPFHLNNNLTWQWIDFPPTLERSLELSRRNHRNSGGPPVSSSSGLSLIDKGWARREELRAFESFLRETISRGYHLSFPGDVQCAVCRPRERVGLVWVSLTRGEQAGKLSQSNRRHHAPRSSPTYHWIIAPLSWRKHCQIRAGEYTSRLRFTKVRMVILSCPKSSPVSTQKQL